MANWQGDDGSTFLSTAAHVYRIWVANTSTTVTSRTDDTWSIWNNCRHAAGTGAYYTSVTTNSATDSAWLRWQKMPHSRIEIVTNVPPPPTPEQLAEHARILEAARVADRERVAKQEAVRKRARGLLMSQLTPAQRATYERDGYFDVAVEGKTYRIAQGTHGNVALVDAKGTIERYCAQPDGVPVEDAMLAQLLSLRFAPATFLGKANVTRVRN